MNPDFATVEKFFSELSPFRAARCQDYWQSIAPTNENDFFLRWLFAFLSVHTTWESNVRAYLNLRNWKQWIGRPHELKAKLIESKVGLHEGRTRFIDRFAKAFWRDPSPYCAKPECWVSHRNTHVKEVLGLGTAKVSFSLEMSHSDDCKVVCMDTHLFKFYGLDQQKHIRLYETIERHWGMACEAIGIPCYIARCLFWDQKQNKEDSRYWSFVFES